MSRRLPRGVNSLACQREACQEVPSRGWWSPCTVTVRQREGTKKMRRVGSKSLFNVTGNPPSLPNSLPQVPLSNRIEALGLEGEVGEDVVESPPMRSRRQSTPCLKTASSKKE